MRCLELIGVADAARGKSQESINLPFLHYRSGAVLQRGMSTATRPGAAQAARQIHRADLHSLLTAALLELDPQALCLDHRLTGFSQDSNNVMASFANGAAVRADMLIGCDGVRSLVRDQLVGSQALRFSGQVAFRCLVPMELARPHLHSSSGAVYIGSGGTFNRYPLRDGSVMNCVGLARADVWQQEGWNTPATNDEFLAQFADWHPEVRALIGVAPARGIIKWGLFVRDPLPRWGQGRVTLLGDAAHPMLPFLGLGAAMAIEDGAILNLAISNSADCVSALQRYAATRLPRTTRIYHETVRQGQLVQASDPENYGSQSAPAHDSALFDYDPLSVDLSEASVSV